MLSNIPVRFFVVDYQCVEAELIECDEFDFIASEGNITYERHTVRENGCNQICLTKGLY